MDDLSEKLDRLLGSPDGMKRIEELMGAFGAAQAAPAQDTPPPQTPPSDAPDLTPLFKLLPLLTRLQQEDDSSALLKALRPHLKDERQKRLDEAGELLKLARFLPLLTELSEKGDESS